MSEDNLVEPLEIAEVKYLINIKQEQLTLINETERQIMFALWNLRGKFRVEDMKQWTGWSKQTIYNKWAKYGLRY